MARGFRGKRKHDDGAATNSLSICQLFTGPVMEDRVTLLYQSKGEQVRGPRAASSSGPFSERQKTLHDY